MLIKIYETLWGLIGVAAFVLYLTGNLSEMAMVVFGFICFGMIFMGMISVLPFFVTHQTSARH